jgi:predicted nucleic acid-binding protein
LARRKREKSISARTAQAARLLIDRHVRREFFVVPLSTQVIKHAQDLSDNYPLRAYDAVQLASALEANGRLVTANQPPLTFVCADNRLLNAATTEGLQTHNPV